MGTCCSCFTAEPSSEPASNSAQDRDKEEAEPLQLSSPPVEAQLNGNSRVGAGVQEKPSKSLGSLIPGSLTRAAATVAAEKDVSDIKIGALFETYKDPDKDAILADGVERLCADLNLSPDEFRVLILAWRMNAEQMCQFTRTEFVNGCRCMHVDSIKGIQARLPEIVEELSEDPEMFKSLYRFTFRFGLDVARGQRILPAEMAIILWRLVFTGREPEILSRWLAFLESHPEVRGIPCDTWNMFLNFAESVGNDLSSYNDTEAWPTLLDDFVEYENDQANQNVSKDKSDSNVIKQDCD